MVPWHPPCALISLIFSSLDPETNCFVTLKYTIFRLPLLRFATGLHIESLLVQLSRCNGFPAFLAFRQKGVPFSVRFANPESDTDSNAIFNSFRCDAVRLCQPASCAFDLLSNSVAMLYPPCWWLLWTIDSRVRVIVSTIG